MEKQIVLIRHAEDYSQNGEVAVSERDCELAISSLRETIETVKGGGVIRALVDGVPILHSDRVRAKLTAERIGSFFGAKLFESQALGDLSIRTRADSYPMDFAGFLNKELGEEGVSAWDRSGSVVVVAHEPLIAIANGRHHVPHCYPFLFNESNYQGMVMLANERRHMATP
ncbi:MAG: hypothetical protein QG623_354 [Patescibacteria group bacterium]|nr:hypothetical protein [Patescibacteria group bacterium]